MKFISCVPILFFLACATEPPPLDRTQPEAVPKAIFAGEWIYKNTVVDTDWQNVFTFIGEETATYDSTAFKVRWEITQDLLNAYRIPQRYRDPKGNLVENAVGSKSMILSFKVKKHYDIRYRYNSTTQEDLNILEENTDRPWNEREYMEVDWSQNLVTNISNPTITNVAVGDISREPVSVYENVEFFSRGATPDQDERIDTRKWNPKKDPEVYVINIDTRETITTKLSSWDQIWWGPIMEPVTVKFRHSLMRVPPPQEQKYVPLQYADDVFRRFGFFRTEYEVYDPERGTLENQKRYFINRWDLSGNRKIVWYASPEFQEQLAEGDEQLRQVALRVIKEWNTVLREATGRADDPMEFRENEPLLDGDGKQVVNPDGSRRWKRELGDLRWSFLSFVKKPQSESPLGYGPSTPDSDTGELVNGTVNVYGNWIDFVVRRAMDEYDVVSGNCTLDQVKDGFFYDPATKKCDSPVFTGEYKGGIVKPKTGALVSEETAGKTSSWPLTPALMASYWGKADVRKPDKEIPIQFQKSKARAGKFHDWQLKHPLALDLGRFASIAGTKYEAMMVPKGSLYSLLPHAPSADDHNVVAALSPARRLSPAFLKEMKETQQRRSGRYDDPIMFEPAIHAFVEEMKGKPRDEVYRQLREWIWFTSTLHEMGHTLGLRHNFRGSADQSNFPPEYFTAYDKYWKQVEALRAKYQAKIEAGDPDAYQAYVTGVDAVPTTHNRWASTSIMDYMGDWVDWMYPVGSWDRAAILMGYGGKVEVRDKAEDKTWKIETYKEGDFGQDDPYDPKEKAPSGRFVRYYMFCSDEKIFDDLFCSEFDIGVTATEITRNFIRDARTSYFFKNFKRQSTGFEARRDEYYINKWLWTYYMRAKVLTDLELGTMRFDEMWDAAWDKAMPAIAKGPETRDMIPGYHHDGAEDLLRATLIYYYYLLFDVLGRPDYGYYQLAYDSRGDLYFDWTEEQYLADDKPSGKVAAGTGWGWDDRWDVQDDIQQYYPHLTRIGVELDKIIALEILSVPAIFNDPLTYEKANGLSFWNALWTGDGIQTWGVIKGLITDNFSHTQNPWCMKCDGACMKDWKAHPPQLRAYPMSLIEGMAIGGILDEADMPDLPEGKNRCGPDEYPMRPGMDALFAIYPIYYGIAGASHPWYSNGLSDHMDSQVLGGNHQFTPPKDAATAQFVNSSGTKTYVAAQTSDGMGVSYQLVQAGERIRDRIDMVEACIAEHDPGDLAKKLHRTCDEVICCYYCCDDECTLPDFCEPEGWDWSYMYDSWKWRDLDRVEAMLIMMQDMIDIAGHYQWWAPEVLGEDEW